MFYLYLFLFQFSSFLYADTSFWPILCSFSLKKLFYSCKASTGKRFPPFLFEKIYFSFIFEGWLHKVHNSRLVVIFFQHYKNFTPLSPCVRGFWEVRCNSFLCSSTSMVLKVSIEIASSSLSSAVYILLITPQRHSSFMLVLFTCSFFLEGGQLGYSSLCLHFLSVLTCYLSYPLEPLVY